MSTTYTPDYEAVVHELAGHGFSPCDGNIADDDGHPSIAGQTVDYFGARGWDAYRIHGGDTITFARFGDEGHRITVTTLSGCISTEAQFSPDRFGTRLFTDAAAARP